MNKQITEDFVSFEIAQLLKEKGFANLIDHYYDTSGRMDGDFTTEGFPCCTHQMALKWLREVHKIVITIYPYGEYTCNNYQFDIYKDGRLIVSKDDGYDLYEQAIEAAILYVLKNLI